jgi:hypothetical protein
VEEHAEPQPERAPTRPAARAPDGAPAHPLLGWQRLAGNQAVLAMLGRTEPAVPVQRLMVRMPNPFGRDVQKMVGDVEVDEIEESLNDRGAAGAGGKHNWNADWVFPAAPTTEASVFYGHGNRTRLGGLAPGEFVAGVSADGRQLKNDTAFKFVACGGGKSQAGADAAYGAEVADRLRGARTSVPGEDWSGALKATEGLVYYTKTYKTVLPAIPAAIDMLLEQLTAMAESSARGAVTTLVRSRLTAVDAAQRATDFTNFRDVVANFYASRNNLADQGAKVRAIVVPHDKLSDRWLRKKLKSAMETMFPGNVRWLALKVAFMEDLSAGNCLDNVWASLDNVENAMKADAKKIWAEFRDKLQREAAVPPRTARPAAKVGTVDSSAAAGPDERFAKWQNFGDVLWAEWKASRVPGGGKET